MKDYEYRAFDEALMNQIERGCNTLKALRGDTSDLVALAEPYRIRDPWRGRTPVSDVIERRLQVLRRTNLVRFNGDVWEVLNRDRLVNL